MSAPLGTERGFPPPNGDSSSPAIADAAGRGAFAASDQAPLLGPRYELHAPLGVGGMSRVYRVLDRARGEVVALKVLNDDSASTLGSEFRFIASLNHPGIISVHDFGLTHDGRPYFTMELVEGGDIVQFARAAPLRQTILAVRGVLETLEFVHSRGILHGDLKPANILVATTLGGERCPKLLDFGIARLADDPEQRVSGTLHYMAPELIVRRQRDRRTDLYAMGAVLFELLCGEVPFDAPDAVGILRQHLKAAPRDPSELRAEAGGQLAEVALRLLEKSPEDRFQRAREVAVALDEWLGASADPSTVRGVRRSQPPGRRSQPPGRRSQPPGRRSTRPPPRGAPWVVAEPRVWLAGGARFVGRERELHDLAGCALEMSPRASSPTRAGALWLLGGQPGIGKTRLLQELRVRAQLGGVGCLGVDFAGSRSPAEALERLAATIAGAAGSPDLPGEVSRQLAHDERPAGHGADGLWAEPETPRIERLIAAAELLASVCTKLAESRPVVLALDHLDDAAADAATALRSFCATVVQAQVMVVAAGTVGHAGPLAELATIPGARRVELGRVDREATGQIVRSLLGEMEGSAAIIAHVHAESGGNPGAVERVVRSLAASGAIVVRGDAWVVAAHLGGRLPVMSADAGLEQIAQSVLADLDPAERTLAEAAACIGARFDGGLLAAVVSQAPDFREVPELVLRDLVERGVLEPAIDESDLPAVAPAFRFAHRATHELLLRELAARPDAPWSARIVAAFAARPTPTAPDELEILARHYRASGRLAEAAEIAGKLVARAIDAGLSTDAPELLREALAGSAREAGLDLSRWCELGCLLADFERRSGSVTQAIRWYDRVVQAGTRHGVDGSRDEAGDPGAPRGLVGGPSEAPPARTARLIAAARRELGDLLMERGADDGESTLVEALREARDLGDQRLVGQAAYTLANRLMLAGRHDEAEQGLAEALDVAERSADRQLRARSLKLRAMLHWYRGEASKAAADAREAAHEYQLLGSPHGAALALGALGNALLSGRRLEQAGAVYREALEHARVARWLAGIAKGENALALVAFHGDDWDGACEHWRASLAILDRTGNCVDQVVLTNNLGFVAALRGDWAAATPLYQEALALARRVAFRKGEALVLGNLGELDMLQGRLDEARQKLDDALEIACSISAKDQEVECCRRLLELDLAAGAASPAQVAEAALRLLARAEADEVTAELPHVQRVAGAALAGCCDGDLERAEEATRFLEQAARGFAELGSRFEAARVVALAALLAAGGLAPAERLARGVDEARKLFRRLRAQPEIDRLRAAKDVLARAATGPVDTAAAPPLRSPSGSSAAEPSLHTASSFRPTLDPELRQLLDALRAISGPLGMDLLLTRIVDQAIELTGAERGFVVLCDNDGKPVVRVSRGIGGTDLDDDEIRASRTVLARVMSERQPLVVEGLAGLGPELLSRSVVRLGICSIACLPLEIGEALVGLLYLDSRRGGKTWSRIGRAMLAPFVAHAAVAVSNARMLEQHERRAELLANGAHELVNPVRAILGYSRMLQLELAAGPAAAAGHASIVQDQANRLSRAVAGLIDLADTEPGRISWTAVSVQVKDLLETAAEQVQPLAAMRGIPLDIQVPHRMPTVFGSRERLIQAVANILATAVGLSEGAGVSVHAHGVAPREGREPTLPPPRPQRDPLLPEPEIGWELSHQAPVRIDVRCGVPSSEPHSTREPRAARAGQRREVARRAVLAQVGRDAKGNVSPSEACVDPELRIAQRVVEQHGGLLWAEELPDGVLGLSFLFPSLVQRDPSANGDAG